MRRLTEEEGGFTLIEVLVTSMIMVLVLFALYSIFDMSLRVFSFGNDETEAVENARLGMERIEREIRATGGGSGNTYCVQSQGGGDTWYMDESRGSPSETPC